MYLAKRSKYKRKVFHAVTARSFRVSLFINLGYTSFGAWWGWAYGTYGIGSPNLEKEWLDGVENLKWDERDNQSFLVCKRVHGARFKGCNIAWQHLSSVAFAGICLIVISEWSPLSLKLLWFWWRDLSDWSVNLPRVRRRYYPLWIYPVMLCCTSQTVKMYLRSWFMYDWCGTHVLGKCQQNRKKYEIIALQKANSLSFCLWILINVSWVEKKYII